jgi:hypothetical protein
MPAVVPQARRDWQSGSVAVHRFDAKSERMPAARVRPQTKEVAAMTDSHSSSQAHSQAHAGSRAYLSFAVQLAISAVAMYLAMYLMIASLAHFRLNLNMLYMTLAMLAPMGIAMLALMPSMYPNRRLNVALHAVFVAMLLIGVWFTREQVLIGDKEFLRSMIPHHSGAILMCEKAQISDPQIEALCAGIIQSQSQEIAQMEAILGRL